MPQKINKPYAVKPEEKFLCVVKIPRTTAIKLGIRESSTK